MTLSVARGTHDDEEGAQDGPRIAVADARPAWSPGGEVLYFTTTRPGWGPFAVGAVSADAKAVRLVTPQGYDTPAVSSDGGNLLVVSLYLHMYKGGTNYCLVDVETGRMRQVGSPRREYSDLAFGRSKGELVFARRAGSRQHPDIYALRLGANGEVEEEWNVLRDSEYAMRPVVSPDRKWLCYALMEGPSAYALKVCRWEGKQAEQLRLLGRFEDLGTIHWMADSKRVFVHTRPGPLIIDIAGGERVDYKQYLQDQGKLDRELLQRTVEFAPSVDGSGRVACGLSYVTEDDLYFHYLAVMDFDGGNFRFLTREAPKMLPYPFKEVQQEFSVVDALKLVNPEDG